MYHLIILSFKVQILPIFFFLLNKETLNSSLYILCLFSFDYNKDLPHIFWWWLRHSLKGAFFSHFFWKREKSQCLPWGQTENILAKMQDGWYSYEWLKNELLWKKTFAFWAVAFATVSVSTLWKVCTCMVRFLSIKLGNWYRNLFLHMPIFPLSRKCNPLPDHLLLYFNFSSSSQECPDQL